MKAPFRNAFTGNIFEDGLDMYNHEVRTDIDEMMMEYFSQNESEKIVAPDTSGVDYFFLEDFITKHMEFDFALIEQDFLDKCRGKLQEFNDACTCWDMMFRMRKPVDSMRRKIIALIYSGAKLKDAYCVEMIRYLYKTYHKQEYNSLKRFHKISTDEIFGFAENEYGGCNLAIIGRVMGMCPFMNIKYHQNCAVLFKLLLKRREEWIAVDEKDLEFQDFEDGLFSECREQVDAWVEEAAKEKRHKREDYKYYQETSDFVEACLRNQGYSRDFVYECIENNMGLKIQMARTLAVLKTAHPDREYTYEQVQRLTNIYDLVAALTDVSDSVEYEIGYLTGDRVDPYEMEDAWYKAESITVRESTKKEERKVITNVAPVSNGDISEEDYIKEIESLRKKLHEKEQENQYLRDQNRAVKRSASEADGLIRKYEEERDELIALREFVYNTEHEEEAPVSENRLPEMKKFIADKNVVIIGGHINWQNKMKEHFPNWMFVALTAYKTVDGAMLENKDKVYFYTDYISHVSYYKFISAVRERKIPFGYIGSYNIDKVIRQVYEDLQ